jgi:hypothetical protein
MQSLLLFACVGFLLTLLVSSEKRGDVVFRWKLQDSPGPTPGPGDGNPEPAIHVADQDVDRRRKCLAASPKGPRRDSTKKD